jgi:ATP-binding cassette subfamily F protein uup
VASTVLGLDGNGRIAQFADFAQWEQWIGDEAAFRAQTSTTVQASAESAAAPEQASKKKKLSYLEAREFATIEQRVEESDARLAAARARVEDPAIASDAAALQAALAELSAAEAENEKLYGRWAELTDKAV